MLHSPSTSKLPFISAFRASNRIDGREPELGEVEMTGSFLYIYMNNEATMTTSFPFLSLSYSPRMFINIICKQNTIKGLIYFENSSSSHGC